MDHHDSNNKEKKPERVLADILSGEGFSIAVVSPDVTLEELDELLPQRKQKNK